jgi:hypothetical protein
VSDGDWVHVAGNTIPANPNYVGRAETNSGRDLKMYCGVPDSSALALSDPSTFDHVTVLGSSASPSLAFQTQLCTDFQDSLGGVCDNAASGALGSGFKVDSAIGAAWQGTGNTDQLHYIYVFDPGDGSGCGIFGCVFAVSFVTGYTVWHS